MLPPGLELGPLAWCARVVPLNKRDASIYSIEDFRSDADLGGCPPTNVKLTDARLLIHDTHGTHLFPSTFPLNLESIQDTKLATLRFTNPMEEINFE